MDRLKPPSMKLTFLCFTLFPAFIFAQVLTYSPNRKIERTVSKTYYDTEFIFIKNPGGPAINLQFEVIESTFLPDWSATICTNAQCFNTIPNGGQFGQIGPGSEGYISFNFAANETTGSGYVKFRLFSDQSLTLSDTVTFEYTVTEDGSIKAGPWANVNFGQGVLTVLLENPHLETTLHIFDLNGRLITAQTLEHITSFPLRNYPKGMYLVAIEDENGRQIREKVLYY